MVAAPEKVGGSVHVPGSKSISNRVLLMAAMGEGHCRISGLLQSDDTQVMLSALSAMGAGPFAWEEGGSVLQVWTAATTPHRPCPPAAPQPSTHPHPSLLF